MLPWVLLIVDLIKDIVLCLDIYIIKLRAEKQKNFISNDSYAEERVAAIF